MTKIYIDPGHNYSGGDTGAVGYGLKEQDITVYVGNKLKALLIQNGIDVKMSRNTIYDVIGNGSLNSSLSTRAANANSWGADLFISIHCNAANSKAYGTETYAYRSGTNAYRLAECVQKHLIAETGRTNRGVKTANFAVITRTNMPAILVETAFIDNYGDNQYLASEAGQNALALGIAKGVCEYLGIELTNTESEENLMSKEYDELNGRITDIQKENNRQNEVINAIGKDIQYLGGVVDTAVYNYIDDNMPDWAKPTIQKLVNKGYLKGDEEGKLGLTTDLLRVLVINDRAGIYGE